MCSPSLRERPGIFRMTSMDSQVVQVNRRSIMNASSKSTKAAVPGFSSSDVVKFAIGAVLVALLAVGGHGVSGSVAEPDTDTDVANEEVDSDYFPPGYAFHAVDFDDPFEVY